MNKPKLNKLYDEKLEVWKDQWTTFHNTILNPLPDEVLDIIVEGDKAILEAFAPLNQTEKLALDRAIEDYRTECLINLGLEPQVWITWLDKDNFSHEIDFDKPDLSKTPQTLKLAPFCPDDAFQEALAWTYNKDWQGVVKAILVINLSMARVRMKKA